MASRFTISAPKPVGDRSVFDREMVSARERMDRLMRPPALGLLPDDVVKAALPDEVLQKLALLRPPVTQGDAILRWGKPPKFNILEPDQPDQITYNITNNYPDDPDDPEQDGAKIYWRDGVKAAVETIRVEQDGNPENWVDVDRFVWVIFQDRETGILTGLNLAPLYQD